MILLMPMSVSVCSLAPWNGAGYSIAPTPTIVPWPAGSRGTEWLVPMPPGLVSEIVVPAKSSAVSVAAAGLADDVLVGLPELQERHRFSQSLIDATTSVRAPSLPGRSMASPKFTCSGVTTTGLPSTSA